jgi:hypothetical protein
MDNLKDLSVSSKRLIKRGPTPLAPSPSPSNAQRIESVLRQKYIFGDAEKRTGKTASAA